MWSAREDAPGNGLDVFVKAISTNLKIWILLRVYILKEWSVRQCYGGPLRRLRLHSCTHPQPSYLPLPHSRHSSRCSASMPESLTANKIITDTLLMSQNYIKSLKVDECTWQTIHFGGPVGREPGHLALTHLCKPNHLRCSREAPLAAAASHVLCDAPQPSLCMCFTQWMFWAMGVIGAETHFAVLWYQKSSSCFWTAKLDKTLPDTACGEFFL